MMVTAITSGICVSVRTRYRPEYSDPLKKSYLFSYIISIENRSDYVVKLKRRHWYIFDSCGTYREVEGEGVVGLQPELQPGETHEYESACNLTTEMGRMHGTYTMERKVDGGIFQVAIPAFEMFAPFVLN